VPIVRIDETNYHKQEEDELIVTKIYSFLVQK